MEAFFRKVETKYEDTFVRGAGDSSDNLPVGWKPFMIDSPPRMKLMRRIAVIKGTNMVGMY